MSITRRQIFETLTLSRIRELLAILEIDGLTGLNKAELIYKLSRKSSLKPETVLNQLKRDELKALCEALELDTSGREKQLLIDRLLGNEPETTDKVAEKHAPYNQKRTMATQPPRQSAQSEQPSNNTGNAPVKEADSTTLSSFIWKIADDLWGDFKHTDFARIILPLLLLRRLECVLEPTKAKVLKEYEKEKNAGTELDLVLPSYSGLPFYNTSEYSLETLGGTKTASNLEQYISRFSSNVRLIFEEFGFANTIHELNRARLLYRMTSQFAAIDLHPEVVSDRVMSNTYEQLIRDFAASINEKAGEFMTPKDVVHLATKLVLAPDEEAFSDSGIIRTVYDPTCGLLGFITDAIDVIRNMGSTTEIVPFGQELDPKTHAMALTAMLIRGYRSENIKQGSSLSNDQLADRKFHYGLANPPFGIKWEKDREVVEKEHKELGYAGRFGPGLPRVSDGSMLFLMHLVSKMERPGNGGGRVGIVLSGSPLFTGDAGSGESEIRRWLLEQDRVEAIIALPTDMFFNTGIGTYVWILSNHKEKRRKGKVQLINLANTWSPMRKSEGTKRRCLSEQQIDDVVREYAAFEETERGRIFATTDFAYRKVAIKRPLRAKLSITRERIKALYENSAFQKLDETQQAAWMDFLRGNMGDKDYHWAFDIVKQKHKAEGFGKTSKALANALVAAFMERDENAEPVLDDHGHVIPDTSFNDTESVPFGARVKDYFASEVLPHVPDAFIDYSVRDSKDGEVGIVGYEINFNRYFYKYVPPRPLQAIDAELKACEARIQALLQEVAE
jgi:type I restriction enzyme M protein